MGEPVPPTSLSGATITTAPVGGLGEVRELGQPIAAVAHRGDGHLRGLLPECPGQVEPTQRSLER